MSRSTTADLSRAPLSAAAALGAFITCWIAIQGSLTLTRTPLANALGVAGLRESVILRIAFSTVLLWSLFGVGWALLRLQNLTLSDIGWRRTATRRGWAAALAVALAHVAILMSGPLAGVPTLSDWSPFRVGVAVSAALSAGICEETLFRGFVMRQAQALQWPSWAQVTLSAGLFGMGHLGWGSTTHGFSWLAAIGSVIWTTGLGAMLAVAFLIGRRSLTPVITAHGLIDLIEEPWLLLLALAGGFSR